MNSTCKAALAALVALLPGAPVRAQGPAAGDPPTAARLQALQGSWEGVLVGDDESDRRKITFTGQSLRFLRPKLDEWYEATFTLPAGTSLRTCGTTPTRFVSISRRSTRRPAVEGPAGSG